MRFYLVYKKDGAQDLDGAEFLRDGFCFASFFFNFLWLAYHKMWKIAVLILLGLMVLLKMQILEVIAPVVAQSLIFGLLLLAGYHGKDWYANRLQLDGFKLVEVIAASNVDKAKLKYLRNNTSSTF